MARGLSGSRLTGPGPGAGVVALEKRVPGKLTELLFLSARLPPYILAALFLCLSTHALSFHLICPPFLSFCLGLPPAFLSPSTSCPAVRGHGPALPAS